MTNGPSVSASSPLCPKFQRKRKNIFYVSACLSKHRGWTPKLFCGYCKCLITGESGTSHTQEVHRYYKCRGTRKGGTCKKKTIKKKWIEEVVILLIQKFIFDDEFLNRLADMLIAKLNAESSTLPILRKQLDEIEKGIDNIVNAIQAGILTASTKQRLEQLEAEKSELSVQILKEGTKQVTFAEIEETSGSDLSSLTAPAASCRSQESGSGGKKIG